MDRRLVNRRFSVKREKKNLNQLFILLNEMSCGVYIPPPTTKYHRHTKKDRQRERKRKSNQWLYLVDASGVIIVLDCFCVCLCVCDINNFVFFFLPLYRSLKIQVVF